MKTRLLFLGLSILAGIPSLPAQNFINLSLSQSGVLTCTNLNPGSTATVQYATSLIRNEETNWAEFNSYLVGTNGAITVTLPMQYSLQFYRVQDMPATPTGMALIPAGTFTMGDTLDGLSDAKPKIVYVSAFFMDVNLVSLNLWNDVFNYATNHGYVFLNSGAGKAMTHPVNTINWYDCLIWCNARSAREGLIPVYYTDSGFTQIYTHGKVAVFANWQANGFRLPTEAEWEKGARGGLSGQRFPWGNTINENYANYFSQWSNGVPFFVYDVNSYAGFNTNFNIGGFPYTSPVGSFPPNGYGLCDMVGNLIEWTWDLYGGSLGQPTTNNPTGAVSGSGQRGLRGCYWNSWPVLARCAFRNYDYPEDTKFYFGFRSVRRP
ncbi:MAG: SUMF1/EgtB/PvdO family nonheme iron enzyme [Verrucomicrobiota bacterium]